MCLTNIYFFLYYKTQILKYYICLIKNDDGIHQKKENQRKNILLHRRRNIRQTRKSQTKSNQIPRQHKKHTTKIRILGRKPLISTQRRFLFKGKKRPTKAAENLKKGQQKYNL